MYKYIHGLLSITQQVDCLDSRNMFSGVNEKTQSING